MNNCYGLYTFIVIIVVIITSPAVYCQSASEDLFSSKFRYSTAIDTILDQQFNKGLRMTVPDLLTGRVPGLIVSQPGGDPDAITDLRIRGISSIESTSAPLIVIDDVIVKNYNSVDPLDILHIEILKDAASSARYGVLGNAGVIRITTKRGEPSSSGEITVRYHGTYSSSFKANQIEVLNAEQYRLFNSSGVPFSGSDFGSETTWQDEISQNGISHFHNLVLAGQNESTTYRISGIHRKNNTILKGSGNQQLRARVHFTHKTLNERLFLNGSISLLHEESTPGLEEIYRYATIFNPTAPIKDEAGNYFETGSFDSYNPVAMLEQSEIKLETHQMQFLLSGQYNLDFLMDGLSTKMNYSRELDDLRRSEYYGKNLLFRGGDSNGLALLTDSKIQSEYFESNIKYRGDSGRTKLIAQTGFNAFTTDFSEKLTSASNFISDQFFYNSIGSVNDPDNGKSEIENRITRNSIYAYFGQVDISHNRTFSSTFILRREGSTRFGVNNKWGTFYGISAGMEWAKIVDISLFDQIYTRIGFGKTGQDAPFDGISQLTFGTGPYLFNGSEFVPSIRVVNNSNPDLKWEEKKELNLGVDIGVLSKRLTFSIDYFRNKVNDLIYEIPVDVPPNLIDRKWVNIGEIENKGVEMHFEYHTSLLQDFHWTSTLLYSASSSKLVSLSNSEFQFDELPFATPGAPGMGSVFLMQVVEGGKIGEFVGPEFAGFDSEGRWEFVNANGEIVTSDELTQNDNKVIGNGLPDFTVGLNNRFQLNNWDIELFWQGVFGHDLVNSYNLFYENPTSLGGNYNIVESARELPLREGPFFSDYYVEDATYFRLQNLTIAYDFNLSEDASVNKLRFYTSGNNLWTFTGFTGVDPEVRLSSFPPTDSGTPQRIRSVLIPGIERRNIWPTQTSLLLGVVIEF